MKMEWGYQNLLKNVNRAKLLYNEITEAVDSMGQSISENEKRQVLMDILESLCK